MLSSKLYNLSKQVSEGEVKPLVVYLESLTTIELADFLPSGSLWFIATHIANKLAARAPLDKSDEKLMLVLGALLEQVTSNEIESLKQVPPQQIHSVFELLPIILSDLKIENNLLKSPPKKGI